MITIKSLVRRIVLSALALLLVADRVNAQTSFQTGPQDAWNYTGTYAALPSPSGERRCVVATLDGVYVGAYNSAGNNWYIEKYDNSGAFVMKFPKAFTRITGLAANAAGTTIYGFDGALGKGYAFSSVGAQKFEFGSGYYSSANGWFNGTNNDFYHSVAVNSAGLIYVADYSNYRVQIFNADGSFKSTFGGYGSLPGQFGYGVRHVAVSPRDEVLVLDDSAALQKFSATGEYVSKAVSTSVITSWSNWYTTFTVSRDGMLMVGSIDGPPLRGVMFDTSTMISDRQFNYGNGVDNIYVGHVNFTNSVSGYGANYVRGASFDPAGNVWMIRYSTVTSGSWSLERFERRMRFDYHKPTKPVLQPTIVTANQQPGSQTVNITYQVDLPVISGGALSGGSMALSGGSLVNGTLVGGTLSGGNVSAGSLTTSGSVTTALIGWLNGIKNWAHLVVPSVDGGTLKTSSSYFWSDLYDPSTRIDNRIPLNDMIRCSTVDGAGNVYVVTDYCVRKITPSGSVSLLAGGAGSNYYLNDTGATARFQNPYGICTDASGNVYVTEMSGQVIRKITPSGVVSTLAGSWGAYNSTDGVGSNAGFRGPAAIAADANGNLFVAEWEGTGIRKVTSSGSVTTVAQTGRNLLGIAVNAAGVIYVTDYYSHKILKVVQNESAAATVTTFAGSGSPSHIDGTGTAATFFYPRGLSIDPSGNLYVSEDDNNFVRKITPEGVVSTIGKTASQVYNVSVDTAGCLYAAESHNQLGIGRMVRKGAPYSATTAGILSSAGVLGAGVQAGTQNTVSWDVSKDLPGLSFASLSFEVLAKDDRPEIGVHFVTIPGDSSATNSQTTGDLKISNRPIDEAELSDLWVWLLANRDPRIAISGNSIVFTQAGLDYVANAPTIYDASNPDTTMTVATGGTGGADGGWTWDNWGSTTNRGRAFAYKLMNYRPVTAAEVTRANSGRFNLSSVDHYSAVNLAP